MRYSAANITTVLMLAFTLVVLVARFRARPDTNLPLIYFLVVFGFHFTYPGQLNPNAVLAGAVSSLFLRFEFMSGWLRWILRASEMIVMVHLAWTFYDRSWL